MGASFEEDGSAGAQAGMAYRVAYAENRKARGLIPAGFERTAKDSSGAGSGGRVTEKGGVKEAPTKRREQPAVDEERTSPVQFGKEVKSELSKVSWPSRTEVINYSIVVLITVLVLTLFIGAIDWVFSTFVLELFEPRQ